MSRIYRSAKRFYLRQLSPYYVISFPKSGRTWIKSFLSSYCALFYNIPVFYDFTPVWRHGSRSQVPRIVFEHARHRAEGDAIVHAFIRKLGGKKLVLISRDPRRVVFGYYFQLLKRMNDEHARSLSLGQFIRDPSVGVPRIVRFLNEWYESREVFSRLLMFKYEDCVDDPELHLTRLLEFMQIPVDALMLEKALACSVDTTRKIEEGGLITDKELLSAVERDTPYFETSAHACDSLKRYGGDDLLYTDSFTADDMQYMDNEIKKLSPVFGYRVEE